MKYCRLVIQRDNLLLLKYNNIKINYNIAVSILSLFKTTRPKILHGTICKDKQVYYDKKNKEIKLKIHNKKKS